MVRYLFIHIILSTKGAVENILGSGKTILSFLFHIFTCRKAFFFCINMRPDTRNSVQTNEFEHVPQRWYTPSKWCLRHSSSGLFVVLNLSAWVAAHLPSAFPSHEEERCFYFMKKYSLLVFSLLQGFFFAFDKHSACFMWKLSINSLVFSFCLFFCFVCLVVFQKPKQKDWHPPGGFILGLWALIIMVFFKTYGIKHMKHIFWIWASKMIAFTATLDSLVSPEFCMRVKIVVKNNVEILLLKVLLKSSLLPLFLKRVWHGFNVRLFFLTLCCFKHMLMVFWGIFPSS